MNENRKAIIELIEEWKDVPWYEGLYQASNLWNIRNRWRNVLRPSNHRQWYKIIVLTKDNKRKSHMIHRLVLMSFKGVSELECNHIDWIKDNNKIENLEYCTSSENKIHAYNTWLMFKIWNSYKKLKS